MKKKTKKKKETNTDYEKSMKKILLYILESINWMEA